MTKLSACASERVVRRKHPRSSLLVVVERLSALLAEWPCNEIVRIFVACDIRVAGGAPPGNGARQWLIQKNFRSLDWTNAVDVVRLQMLCKLTIDSAWMRIAASKGSTKGASRRIARKLEDLEQSIRQCPVRGGWQRKMAVRNANLKG